jgi:hypothetical protein
MTGHTLPTVRIPDFTGGSVPHHYDRSALSEMRSHFHHNRGGLKRETEA